MSKLKKRYIHTIIVLLSYFSMHPKIYALFGDGETPLIDYYEFGRSQTGVASIFGIKQVKEKFYSFLGTVNLIECDNPALKGRVLLSAAHVVRGTTVAEFDIRFIDRDNAEFIAKAEAVYSHHDQDLCLIILKAAVDTARFKPLRLNYDLAPKDCVNQQVCVFGMTSVFGKDNSSFVLVEPNNKSLRRGMTATISGYESNSINAEYYDPAGFIKIHRNQENRISQQGQDEIVKIRAKLSPKYVEFKELQQKQTELQQKQTELQQKQTTDSAAELAVLQKALAALKGEVDSLKDELAEIEWGDMYREVVCQPFSATISGKESIKATLAAVQVNISDLDIDGLNAQWTEFSNPSSTGGCTTKYFNIGPYQISFHRPLSRLSGVAFHGDSGGAVVKDDSIIGLNRSGYDNTEFNPFEEVTFARGLSETIADYFMRAEQFFAGKPKANLLKEKRATMFMLTIAPFKEWIERTLEKMVPTKTTTASSASSASSTFTKNNNNKNKNGN